MSSCKRITRGSRDEKIILLHASILSLFFFILDQVTKYFIVKQVDFGDRISVIPNLFDITHVTNIGAAFGILSGKHYLLLTISLCVLVVIIVFISKLTEGWAERYYALMLIVSGILGNCTDRILRGEVVDFLHFYIGRFSWPSFNIADSCITVGVIIFIASTIFRPELKKEKTPESE